MPKVKISEYSATANSNTDVASINIDEGCAPSGINNAIRAIMGHLKDFQSGTSNDPFTVGSSGSLTLSYGTANGVAYLNGSKVLTTGSALVFDGTNLGIGTTSPSSRLHVKGTDVKLLLETSSGATSYIQQLSASPYNVSFFNQNAGSLIFGTNDTERARIDSSGNLLVGKTSLSTTTVGVELRPGGRVVSTLASSTSGDSTYEVYSTGAGAYRFYVDMSGTIRATSITITAISDERLKENVRDIDTGLNSIMALKPRRFDWKEGKGQDKKNVAGFIAQEFETVFPECVSTSRAGADGIEYKNINHETLIPTLVKSIQEQQALITQLTARITALESA